MIGDVMIIGIAGTIGAGKGTVVEYLKEKGFAHYSSSDTLREILKERGVIDTRENLSVLADELANEKAGGILYFSYERAKRDGADNAILEAIHRESEADFLRSVGGKVLGVDADVKTRYERAIKRQEGEKDNVTFEQFLEDSKREDDGKGSGTPHIRAVIENADAVVMNDSSLEVLHAQIEDVLEKIENGHNS